MHWLILVGFIAVHLLIYVEVIRQLRMFASESTTSFITPRVLQSFF
jgi:hypothetical protein